MSSVSFGKLLLGSVLVLAVLLLQTGASGEASAATVQWGSLCNSPIQIQGCLQSCRGAFDPDKEYAVYSMCLEECRIACKKAKKRGFF